MNRKLLGFVVAGLILGAIGSFAQDSTGEFSGSREGDTELQFSGAVFYYTSSGDDLEGSVTANLRLGKFVSPRNVLGLGITLSGPIDPSDSETDDFIDGAQGELFWKFYTRSEGTFSPYWKANYFFPISDNQDDGSLAVGFGLNNWIKPNVSFFWEVNYGTPIQEFGDTDFGLIISLFGVGVSF